jgi:hypothetical protein
MIGTSLAGEITQFRGVLPPEGSNRPAHRPALPPNRSTPGGLILHALNPLRGELDAALARNDRQRAVKLAYQALAQVADALAAYRGDALGPGQIRVHALLVDLKPLPLEPMPDGTLAENGTEVTVNYRNWSVAQHEAEAWTQELTRQFYSLWPGAWFIVPPQPQAVTAAQREVVG